MLLDHLLLGFSTVLSLANIGWAFLGCLLGTMVGVLPGIGPVATMAMLMPAVHTLDATSALIMLAGIYYGAQYGGSTTAILLNMPGEASAVATAMDGHAMAQRGRAGAALTLAALGSFAAGTLGTAVVAAAAVPLTAIAYAFGPADYAALIVLGLVGAVVLATGSVLRALAMAVIGMLLGLVGQDVMSGLPRFTLGVPQLFDGIGFVGIAVGLFGWAEVADNLIRGAASRRPGVMRVGSLWPTRQEALSALPAVGRGSMLGALLGVLPGGGALMAAFAAYAVERRWPLKRGEPAFGQGNVRGVAGPESANNAGAQTSFIPLLTLGVPPNAVMAVMVGAMMLKGIAPGPQVIDQHPGLFWGLIASMWVGNAMLLVLNLPLVGLWVRLLTVPYRWLYPGILVASSVGLYAAKGQPFDLLVAAVFTLIGLLMRRLRAEPAPLLLGLILGPMLEEKLRQALLIAGGHWELLLRQPLVAVMLLIAAAALLLAAWPKLRPLRATRAES